MKFYFCSYTFIDKRICEKGCYHQEGCTFHWKIQPRTPCGKCDMPTTSSYSMCVKHSGKYHRRVNYQQKKQDELRTKIAIFENHISNLSDSMHEVLNKYNLSAESNLLQLRAHADELSTMLPDWKVRKDVKKAFCQCLFKKNQIGALVPNNKKKRLTIKKRAQYCAKTKEV
ncbi:17705_t:CDS:2 [Cetraspora pellucida]|uniref:17705_t:CDS:1 n=1 Tax=Cetraspora pellucida TaxID=1433469 RepID=A0ACA9KN18_9GLOM|nr:17705_t:CDS:2 [Cetraspora pellucida]